MANRSHPLLWGAAFTGAALLLPGLNTTLRIRRYTVRTGRFSSPVRLAVASDVHAGDYGEGQNRLLSAIRSQAPDLILIPGDLFERSRVFRSVVCLIRGVVGRYRIFFVSGNHLF